MMSEPYDFEKLEAKWRPYWREIDLYRTGTDEQKPKHYVLDFFPYPSGDGLSVGHCRNYVPTCVAARYKRKRAYNVLHPMGWDAFGLPAENYAIDHGIHPRITTQRHNANYRRQMELVECSYDWSREFSSTDPEYYRWTQWFFLLLFERGLAYRATGSQWWCPVDKTILANEQVINGRCWRCGSLVTKKDLQQWYFKITGYADRLLEGLERIDWPEPIKVMQRNWIGRSEGAEVEFGIEGSAGQTAKVTTFTTRPDTLFGVTFLALAPEHPLVAKITTVERLGQVREYVEQARRATEVERLATDKEKSGVFSGAHARHPLTGQAIPIWVADYVLMGYGSGAVMGVPAHDTRDFAFAQKYGLDIVEVVSPDGEPHGSAECFTEPGIMINSGAYSGMSSQAGGAKVTADLMARGLGREQVTYKMRDWLISRQRYWGAPIPIIHCPDCGPVPVPKEELPVRLPDMEEFAPADDGRSPLARNEAWLHTTCPECGGPATRETDTMDGFACSSWYFLRFASPHYQDGPFDPAAVRYWLPVDTYVGGAEHAVMHLLYARFWTKVMFDAGLIAFDEPFSRLRNQGVLHAADGQRMSKSKGNVVTPDEVVAEHGADALRTYILFIGPFDGDVIWDDANIKGVDRFLERYWKLAWSMAEFDDKEAGEAEVEDEFERQRHRLVHEVTADFERYKFNTAVAALMKYLNTLVEQQDGAIGARLWRRALETFTNLLSPIAPFITEEIWQGALGHSRSVHEESWPNYDETMIAADTVSIMIQVNGRLRDRIEAPADIDEAELERLVLAREKVRHHLNGKTVRKTIVVPGRLVNVVAS
jgi:leucyl-tRNA synthetase